MALEFLTNLTQAIGPIQQILSAIKGPEKPKIQPQPEAERYAQSLLKALADPNNSLLKSMASEELLNLQGGVQSDIRSKVLADRRERSMGRSNAFFDPERSDENIAYQISRGTPMLRQQAQQNAINRILQAAGVGKYADAESERQQNYYAALGEQKKGELLQGGLMGRLEQGNDSLQKILQIFQQGNGKPYFPPGKEGTYGPYQPQETIRWNQMRYNA